MVICEAEVALPEAHRVVQTGPHGTFELPNLRPGQHVLVVRRLAFESTRASITVTAGATTAIDVELTRAAPVLERIAVRASTVESRRLLSPGHQ